MPPLASQPLPSPPIPLPRSPCRNQIVKFVLGFKSFQFVSGLVSATQLGIALGECLEASAMATVTAHTAHGSAADLLGPLADAPAAQLLGLPPVNAASDVVSTAPAAAAVATANVCVPYAPGQDWAFPFIFCLEGLRVLVLLASGTLLAGGAAHGGVEELYALEAVRIDAADGALDGTANRKLLRKERMRKRREITGYAPLEGEQMDTARADALATGLPVASELHAATEAARLKFGVERRCGHRLPLFILYDVCVLVGIIVVLGAECAMLRMRGAPTWLLWTKAYYAKLIWALFSFPFVLFALPVLGESLHRSKPTGYDQAGKLVAQLSAAKIRRKVALETKLHEAHARQADYPDDQSDAALKIQSMYRGARVRRGRAMRHVLSLLTPVGLFVPASTIEKWFS